MSRPVLAHIGYHKTGTSWLQQVLFRHHPGLALVAGHAEVFRYVIEPHDLDFDAQESKRALEALIRPAREDGLQPVISAERLSGAPLAGGRDSESIARRLRAVLPEARILIFVREQAAEIASIYRQYVQAGGIGRLEQFLAPPPADRYCWFDPRHFRYDRLVERYRELFGPEMVLVIPYEAFREDNAAICARICAACALPPFDVQSRSPGRIHRSLSLPGLAVLRQVNRLYRSTANPWSRLNLPLLRHWTVGALRRADRLLPRRPERLESRIRARYAGFFAASNRRLEAQIGEDLRRYGYE